MTDLEYRVIPAAPGAETLAPLVFLHEGLGSMTLWRSFPDEVHERCGGPRSLVYSRRGYGRSPVVREPRPLTYMHDEADHELPMLLAELDIERPVLIGHSDGASIALLYAGSCKSVTALVAMAPHVFVEPESLDGADAALATFTSTDMSTRMARHHTDPAATFHGWNDAWRSAQFRDWNITDRLAWITAPVLMIQGTADQYGTLAQLDAIELGVSGPVQRLVLDGIGHAPHAESPDVVIDAIARHITALARQSSTDRSSGAGRRSR